MRRATTRGSRAGVVGSILIMLVRGYQLIPKVGPPRCRFYPSCSAYAIDAVRVHGPLRGVALTIWRLARCHPFHPGGVEYVPGLRDGSSRGEVAGRS